MSSASIDMHYLGLLRDALAIQTVLPWLESEDNIIAFFRTIPQKYEDFRIRLALQYFIQRRDKEEENSDLSIEHDALEISELLPYTDSNRIKNHLKELGNVSNRKEIVVRQLIKEQTHLNPLINKLMSNVPEFKVSVNGNVFEENALSGIKNKGKRPIETHVSDNTTVEEEKTVPLKIVKVETVGINEKDQLSPIYSSSSSSSVDFEEPRIRVPSVKRVSFHNCEQDLALRPKFELPARLMFQNGEKVEEQFPSVSGQFRADWKIDLPAPLNFQDRVEIPSVLEKREPPIRSNFETHEDVPLSLISEQATSLNFMNHQKATSLSVKSEPVKQATSLNFLNFQEATSLSVKSEPAEQATSLNFMNFQEATSLSAKSEPAEQATSSNFMNFQEATSLSVKSEPAEQATSLNFMNYQKATSLPVKSEPAAHSNFSNSKEVPAVPPQFMDFMSLVPQNNTPEDIMLEPDPIPTVDITLEPRDEHVDESLIVRLKEIFPQACPDYLRKLCRGKQWSEFDNLVTVLLSNEYPQRPERVPSPPKELDLDEQLNIVKELLPDADPTYLRYKCEKIGNDVEALNAFINEARELKNYPTLKEYLRKQKFTAQIKQYTEEFNVENFVALFPNPEQTFNDPNRTIDVDYRSEPYVTYFFQSRYDRISVKIIRSVLAQTKFNILASDKILQSKCKTGEVMKSRRKMYRHESPPQNILLLQNLAYLTHKEEIEQYIKEAKGKEEAERKNAKENGLMNECKCCYDNEVMPKDSFNCPNGCVFCKSCIKKSCEISMGEAKTEIMCLNGCPIEFTLHTLQLVLSPKLFSKLAQKKALAEVRAAGIDELESCPFCDFASIPNTEDKIFRCLNPDCMKESCRLCKEENHVPYKCDEVEKDDDVKARVYVENKMTEALLRKCYKCAKSFFKEEGCNKMTCVCGATMCYVCKQPVKDYKHFNGLGGDKFELCPLYSDSNEINRSNVLKAAEAAKSKVDPNKLKIDPTLDIKKHYEQRKKALPAEPHLR
ncbi:uncharacterized protein LOC126880956 isoform X2 [Diabrotica virgifera virgifera]|nr:uncharacterized protein LOC126880956 isoform X2 [Diabrotica virgifera virgifera]